MRAEVLGIGTEILLGQIANTNAQHISQRLADIGVDVLHHQVVGDNVERIAEAIALALSRADVVIATGGLGPTGDDVTRQGIAAALGRALVRRPEIEDFLREKFRRLGRNMPESNLVQADVPEGARYILPERGTAPGLAVEHQGRRLYAVPGVPAEMVEMLDGTILPELGSVVGPSGIVSRVLRATGIAEARVGELLDDLFAAQTNPTLAYLSSAGEVRVRISAKAATREEAAALIGPVEQEVRRRLGTAVFGVDDEELEGAVGRLLRDRGLRLACAESLTGGGVAFRLTGLPGASDYFVGAAVCYSDEAKRSVLGVSEETLQGAGPVSEACAREMAQGARKVFSADVGLATTGVAGPDRAGDHPPGEVWVAVSSDGAEEATRFTAPGDRPQVRRWAEQGALELLRRHVLGSASTDG
ncbi:MAG TPA: competence/damage-inducible protein A [Actinomycetota bacterium]|nr:competence/damage-inducible protein A [Actinomycetota bacterium]